MGSFLERWNTRYAADTDIGQNANTRCQVCHVSAQGGSTAGWNGYGWKVFSLLESRKPFSQDDLDYAFDFAGLDNSDSDTTLSSNLTEIQAGYFPGWSVGAVNSHYFGTPFQSAQIINNQAPPASINSDRLDPPVKRQIRIDERLTTATNTKSLAIVVDGLSWPRRIRFKPGSDDSIIISELNGKTWSINHTTGQRTLFFDLAANINGDLITDVNNTGELQERGLLNLIFHPDYSDNRMFYTFHSEANGAEVDFTTMPAGAEASHQSVVTQWQVILDQDESVTSAVSQTLLRIAQPQQNNNGGGLQIDSQGYLLIGVGDGGGESDRDLTIEFNGSVIPIIRGHSQGNANNPANPLGALLRVNLGANASANGRYGFPMDNPYLSDPEKLNEVYSIGLRNPDDIYLDQFGEVFVIDQGEVETSEVNQLVAGANYGWNTLESEFQYYANGRDSSYLGENTGQNQTLQLPILSIDQQFGRQLLIARESTNSQPDSDFIFATRMSADGLAAGNIYQIDNLHKQDSQIIRKIFDGRSTSQALSAIHGIAFSPSGKIFVTGNTSLNPSNNSGGFYQLTSTNQQLCFPVTATAQKQTVLICL